MQRVRVTILDDLGRPRVEGPETFQVILRMPSNATLGEPSVATVTINDTISDGKQIVLWWLSLHHQASFFFF